MAKRILIVAAGVALNKTSSAMLTALAVALLVVPALVGKPASAEPLTFEAYYALDIPTPLNVCSGVVSPWQDTPRYREPVTGIVVAFKHDDVKLYVYAEWPVSNPSFRDFFGVEFDNNGDRVHMGSPSDPDDAIFLSPSFSSASSGCARDAFLTGFTEATYDVGVGGTNDAMGRMVYINGAYYIEAAKPLVGNDSAGHDVTLPDGSSIGVGLSVGSFGGGASHLATDMSSYSLVLTDKRSKGVGEVVISDPVGLVYDMGVFLLVAVGFLIVFHVVRRRAWRRSPVFEAAAPRGGIPFVMVRRHPISVRSVHWAHATLMVMLIATGVGIHFRVYLFGSMSTLVHVAVGLAILAVDYPLHFAVLWKTKELGVLVRPKKDDFREIVGIAANLFGLTRKYPEHASFDTRTRRYYMDRKYCAFQKALLWGDLLGIVAMAITGLGLYTSSFGWIVDMLGGSLSVRAIHAFIFFYFGATLMGHVYLSFIPYNWGKMSAMVTGVGHVREHVALDEKKLQETAQAGHRPEATSKIA